MAVTFLSGFETNDFSEWASTTGSPAVVGSGVLAANTGSYCMQCDASGSAIYATGSGTVRRKTFFLYIASAPDSDTFIVGTGVSTTACIKLTTSLKLDLYNGITGIDTGATVLSLDTWYRISISSDVTDDDAKVYINGNEELSASTTNLTAVPHQLGVCEDVTAELYFDDVVCDDVISSTEADMGDHRVQVGIPEADGVTNDYDVTSGWALCDNLPADTDYVEDDKATVGRELFNLPSMSDLSISGDTPVAVNIIVRMDRDGGGGTTHSIDVYDNSTHYLTATAGTAAWTQYSKLYATNAPRGSAWTEAIWDAFQIGGYHLGNQDQRMSTCLAMLAYQPSAAADITVLPSAEALTLALPAPTIVGDVTPLPSAQALTISVLDPTVVIGQTAFPDAQALTISVLAPTVVIDATVTPAALALTSSVLAPTILVTTTPSAQALVVSVLAPTIVGDATITPDALALTSAVLDPAIVGDATVAPDALALVISVLDPTVLTAVNITVVPDALALIASVLAPVVANTVTPDAQALTTAVLAPTVVVDATVTPSALTLTASVLAPTVFAGAVITPAAQALTISVLAPTIVIDATIAPTAQALTISATTPVPLNTTSPSAQALTASVLAPTIVGDVTVTPAALALTSSVVTPIKVVLTPPASLSLAVNVLAPTVVGDVTPAPASQALAVSILAPTIVGDATVAPSALALVISVLAPTVDVGGGTDVTVQPAALTLILSTHSVSFSGTTTKLFEVSRVDDAITIGVSTTDVDISGTSTIGDGGTTDYVGVSVTGQQTFHGLARIDWAKIAANGATVTGCTSASAVTDLQTGNDGNVYTCSEVAGGGNDLTVDFSAVTAFDWVRVLSNYRGNATHNLVIQIEVAPFDGSAWHTFDSMPNQGANTGTMECHCFLIPDDAAYINSGVVKVRFLHSASTSNGHAWNFDEVSLYQ